MAINTFGLGPRPTQDFGGWLALTAGSALVSYGLARRSWRGLCYFAFATPLIYRGLAGTWPGRRANGMAAAAGDDEDTRVALGGNRGVHVREAVTIDVPAPKAFEYWQRLENLPRFMQHLESVTDEGERRSHWVACGPAGIRVSWDADIINEIENKLIAWRSVPGSDIVTAGSVNFDSLGEGGGTRVTVHLQYDPPAGKVGDLIATLLGGSPAQTIRADLKHFKEILEARA